MAVGELVDCVLDGFEKGMDTYACFYDLTKAFDCVSHDILLKKLPYYGFSDGSVSLVASYLSDRMQYVSCCGSNSSKRIIKYGVPQGSVLGPTLFLIYINDITYFQKSSNVILFADDTTTYKSYNPTLTDPNADVRETQSDIQAWFLANRLCLSAAKTQLVNFSLRMGDGSLAGASNAARFLGVYLDSKLTWEEHVIYLSKRLSKVIYLIKNLIKFVPLKAVLSAYHSLFVSVATYSILNWGHSSHSIVIFKLQRRCVRVISGLKYWECCRQQFVNLQILTIPCVYILQCLTYVKRNFHLYSARNEYHDYPTRFNTDINIRFLRLSRSRSGSGYYGPKLFNVLPPSVRDLDEGPFRRTLKVFLQKKAFYSLDEFLNDDFRQI